MESAPNGHGHDHGHGEDHIHPPPSNFLTKYVFSTDHKVIAVQFFCMGFTMFLVGGLFALLLRWQIAFPFQPLPFGLGKVIYASAPGNTMPPESYPTLVTMHGTVMVFFVIIPLLTGAFGNYLIPLKIGARDMAFPLLNMLSYWVAVPAGILIIMAFLTEAGGPGAGWTSYPPLSALPQASPGSGTGQTLWLLSIFCVGWSSIMGGINYLTTIINLRAPGMSLTRMPLSVWALFITSVLQVLATPVLAAASILLLFDKLLGTSFFLPAGVNVGGQAIAQAGGGNPLLFQHLFWFYSHPAVYILVLPAMGLVSDIIPTFTRKPIFGYKAMAYSMAAIAGLGFIVWGHHMFQAGMNPYVATSFMVATMVIATPSSVKVFNWLGSLYGGSIRFTTPMLCCLAFVSMFIIGGLSGVFLAATPVDIFFHDTYYVVAHIHYVVFGGSVFGIFAGLYYWFPKVTGRKMSEFWGKVHFWLSFISFNGVFFPMHILGIGGMMRRIADPTIYQHLAPLQSWNVYITMFAVVLGFSQFIVIANIAVSLLRGERVGENPWEATTLEWTTASPPPYYNYLQIPTVHHPPYEFSVPGMESDYIVQSAPPRSA
ncbi:MAG: cbb3-type cytochrome c oxidase subunit I [Candidatus Wallbacteria bacterium]|nr:cbb3-type cytochrome c oxidase subunit I [Candidatus Wallbacteria bacterium]